MINHGAVIERLAASGLFRKVAGAVEAVKALEGNVALPDGASAFVIPLSDSPGEPVSYDPVLQSITVSFGVLYALKRAGDVTGAASLDPLQDLQSQAQACLRGFWVPGTQLPLAVGPGRLMDMSPGILWWLDEFTTKT